MGRLKKPKLKTHQAINVVVPIALWESVKKYARYRRQVMYKAVPHLLRGGLEIEKKLELKSDSSRKK